ncbi:UDP-N-acetylmuramoyl-L-alanyl-D-glutamate--2,6-diaminopimelate ligase [Alicyclobacillus vulcanalis]|uniref:UDP-N-acetylmuramyl-tripeptide synthetase n=1 Tax=Alicyclobacillus vulcanalis TaxID=252246 RepID=A0A1N7PGZ4_9BACL|nr:UDP-N-acetylmuramoyl-L-alanyl-D-glutamate--2,6-diaminopimelate ligase [Alicyclobacillus vulcanalis]SIT09790.1 UDP-N-acetylmuramoylalanyl-D-glutamate--2,6-diaminopimelate ligase [Alicyclobacillus vulcanalis]
MELWARELANGFANYGVTGVAMDSRQVSPGDVFVAIPGQHVDGHAFIPEAVARGAVAIVGERERETVNVPAGIPYVRVPDARRAASAISARVYGDPSRHLTVIGVTGTNGKTTTVHWIAHMLRCAGHRVGTLSSVVIDTTAKQMAAEWTTPEAPQLHRVLSEMLVAGCSHVVMEVSSHALVQHRTDDVDVDVAVFTNLSREHLDFHGTMEQYAAAKALLFRGLSADKPGAVLNSDSPYVEVMRRACLAPVVTYGVHSGDVRGQVMELQPWKTRLRIALPSAIEAEVELGHPGMYNVYNLLAAVAAARVLGVEPEAIREAISTLPSIPGRMHVLRPPDRPMIVIDYAHTPDALAQVLHAARRWTSGRIWLVFGGRGERDKGKRPEMGMIAAMLADVVIITTDSPYSEDPEMIADDILAGVKRIPDRPYEVILDRAQAIAWAIQHAARNDVVLITGRGHEPFQVVAGIRLAGTDEQLVYDALNNDAPPGAF